MSLSADATPPLPEWLQAVPGLVYCCHRDPQRRLITAFGQWQVWLQEGNLHAWMDPEDRGMVLAQERYHLVYRVITPSGSRIRVLDQGEAITLAGQSLWVGMITPLIQPYTTMMEQMLEGVLIVNPQGQITFVNDRFCEMFAYRRQDLLGRSELDVVATPSERERLVAITDSRRAGVASRYHLLIRTGLGKVRRALISGTPLWDPEHRLMGTMGIITDITESVQQGQSLELLQTIIETIDHCQGLSEILAIVLDRVCQIRQWSFGEAWIPDSQGEYLTYMPGWVALHDDLVPLGQHSRGVHLRPGEDLAGLIWQTGQPQWIPDLRRSELLVRRQQALQVGLRSCFGVPLLNRERQVLAVLIFFSEWLEDYDEGLVKLLTGILRQVGVVWQQRQVESRYQSIFENAIEGIFQTTPEGKYLSVNPSLARIYGYDSPQQLMEAIQDISQDLYVDPQRRRVFQALMATQGSVTRFESQVYRRDGQVIWIAEDARAVKDATGKILYYEGLVQDITAQRQAQADLEHSLSLLQTTLDATADGIISVTSQGRLLAYNRRFVELWHLPPELLDPDHNQERLTYLASQTRDPQGFLDRIRQLYTTSEDAFDWIELQDGRIFERYSCPQYLRGDVIGRVWSYRDVTEAKKIERMKNEFVSIVSHELRTPLTSIRGALGLIRGGIGGALPAQVQSLLDIADKNSERLVLLINDILDIDKIESGQMHFDIQRLDIVDLAAQAIAANQTYAAQLDVSLAMVSELPDPAPLVRADPQRLTQVITNLLSNAAKFSPPGETVTLRLRLRDPYVRLEVIDRGPGIPVEFQERIFQKFAQADSSSTRKKGGTGLGLSICKAIMERLEGQIGFESSVGQGTTFWVDIPLAPSLIVTAPPPLPRILVCEDDADIAHLLQLLLKEGHFQVEIACTAAEVKQKLELDQPNTPCPFAAMTLDLALPDQNGIDLIQELHSHAKTANLPIIVVSASGRDPVSLQGSNIPFLDWLTKPIDQDRLISAIRQATHTRSRPRILHIEDDPDILKVVALIVQDLAEVVAATTMQAALQALQQQTFDLILLDWGLPDGSGLDLLTLINSHLPQAIPVVVFSAADVAQDAGEKVAAALIKSQTSNQKLIETIQTLIRQR